MVDKILNDDTKIKVQSLVPVVCYSCPVTFETFNWMEVGDTKETFLLFAKLEKGEAVITEKQQEPVYRALDFAETMLGRYGKVLNSISGSDLMNAKMQEQFKKESQQVQSVVTHDNFSIENG